MRLITLYAFLLFSVSLSSQEDYSEYAANSGRTVASSIVLPQYFDFGNITNHYDSIVWVIRHEFDLGGANVTMPNNVTLHFEGGSLNNYGTITTNNTRIIESNYKVFDGSGTISPELIGRVNPIMFGATLDGSDDAESINKCIQAGSDIIIPLGIYGKHWHSL